MVGEPDSYAAARSGTLRTSGERRSLTVLFALGPRPGGGARDNNFGAWGSNLGAGEINFGARDDEAG